VSEHLHPTIYVPIVVACLAVVLFVLERFVPLRRRVVSLGARLAINLVLSALAFLMAAALVRPSAGWTMEWADTQPFGLLRLLALPGPLQFALGFLLMDLSFYYWHVVNHRIAFLWRFHNVHHIDPDLDVTTAFRFHFGEVAMSVVFRVLQVALIGMPAVVFAAYEAVFQANTAFHHCNVRLPIPVERLLNKLLVTPRMHGIHHSQVQRETNSNYGVVFPWWDRLHRTLGLNVPQADITVGVPGYSRPEDNRLWSALTMPFRKQRDYWQRPDGLRVERGPRDSNEAPTRLAE
jgi:sterol desaturase/sphingolipid hydroxylase (fatty acid hydroxylase superfamily)